MRGSIHIWRWGLTTPHAGHKRVLEVTIYIMACMRHNHLVAPSWAWLVCIYKVLSFKCLSKNGIFLTPSPPSYNKYFGVIKEIVNKHVFMLPIVEVIRLA